MPDIVMRAKETDKKIPGYAVKSMLPHESIFYVTRPRLVSLGMYVSNVSIVLALVVFSAIVEPGFIRLLALPALPLLGMIAGALIHSPVIFVTDRRIVYARRFAEPLAFELAKLKATRVKQTRLERLLSFGELHLLFDPPEDKGEGVFLSYTLSRLPDPCALNIKVESAAANLTAGSKK
jgi:hypothetical protein